LATDYQNRTPRQICRAIPWRHQSKGQQACERRLEQAEADQHHYKVRCTTTTPTLTITTAATMPTTMAHIRFAEQRRRFGWHRLRRASALLP
jgi:hypothetical protein